MVIPSAMWIIHEKSEIAYEVVGGIGAMGAYRSDGERVGRTGVEHAVR